MADAANQNSAVTEGNYYFQVFALSPKDATSTQSQIQDKQLMPQIYPAYFIYGPFILFFALFVAAFGIQIFNKIKDRNKMISAFVIALMIATIPFVLNQIRLGTGNETHASPDMTPKNVRIMKYQPQSVLVTWDTDAAKIGAVKIQQIKPIITEAKILISDNGTQVTQHTLKLNGLAPGYEYTIEIYSGKFWYDNNNQPIRLQLPKK